MRVAALYDIHGNLPALEAVLDEIRRARVDRVVIGGDAIVGPMSREVLETLGGLSLPVDAIAGNCEREVLAVLAGLEPTTVPEAHRGMVRWTAGAIDAAQRNWLSTWPKTLRMTVDGLGDVLFCHATPRNDTEIFVRTTAESALRPIVDPLNVALVVCGHTHMPFDRMVGATRVVNAGSVGMPFGPSGADWLLIGSGGAIEPRHTLYDLDAAAVRIRRTMYPDAGTFAATSVLQPPSADEMLARFARAELR